METVQPNSNQYKINSLSTGDEVTLAPRKSASLYLWTTPWQKYSNYIPQNN